MERASYGLGATKKKSSKTAWLYMTFMVVMAFMASWWMTQQIAASYNFHPALGKPLFGHIYAPWQGLVWYARHPDTAGIMDAAMTEGQLIFVLPQLLILAILLMFSRRPKGSHDIHGSAQWAKEEEIQKAGLLGGMGVYVGAWYNKAKSSLVYLRHNGPEHILAFAPTRSGKGVGLVLPTLLSWPDSALILDIKGENWALTAGWRKSQGHKVLRFDPKNMDISVCFNPLESIRIDQAEAVQDAQAVTSIILDPDGKGMKDYFDKAAFAFFIGAVLHCIIVKRAEGKQASMCDISLMLANPDMDTQELLDSMIEADHAAMLEQALGKKARFGVEIHNNIAASAKEMKNKADRELSGVLSTAGVNLALYRDPTVAHVTGRSDFSIEDLMNHDCPVSLYFIISPNSLDIMRPLTRLILNVVLNRLTERMDFEGGRSVAHYKYRLLLMLDEFTSLGNLGIFERSLAFMAGYGLKAYIIVQDLSQLQGAYTKDESIMSNCHIRIAYAPNKPETARLLSEMVGKTTVIEQKNSLSGSRSGHLKNASVSVSETARALLTPDECMRLPGMVKDAKGNVTDSGDMLIFAAGFSTIYGKQILYFQDYVFSQRAKIEAPVKSDTLRENAASPIIYPTTPKEGGYASVLANVSAD